MAIKTYTVNGVDYLVDESKFLKYLKTQCDWEPPKTEDKTFNREFKKFALQRFFEDFIALNRSSLSQV